MSKEKLVTWLTPSSLLIPCAPCRRLKGTCSRGRRSFVANVLLMSAYAAEPRAVGKVMGTIMQPLAWARAQLDRMLTAPGAQDPGAATAQPGAPASGTAQPIDPARRLAAATLQGGIDVYRQGRSTAVTVAYTAYDPATAATVANAYADAYVQDMLTANASAVGQTTAWMRGRVEELRSQAQAAAAAAEKFSTEHGLIGTTGGDLLTSQAVSELNTSLTAAVGDMARAQAVLDTYDKAVAAGVEGLTSGIDLTIGGEISDALSARISNYNDVRARLQRTIANAGPGAPQVAGLRQTLSSTAQRLFVELQGQQQEARALDQQAQHEVVILADPQGGVVAAASQRRAPDHRLEIAEGGQGRVAPVGAQIGRRSKPHRRGQRERLQQGAPPLGRGAEMHEVVGHEIGPRGLRRRDEARKPFRVDQVVAVHDGDPVTPRRVQREVARGRRPPVPAGAGRIDGSEPTRVPGARSSCPMSRLKPRSRPR